MWVGDQSITYDNIGNPTSYYNGTRWTFEWGAGKKLNRAEAGDTVVEFTYDADGQRLTKKVDGVTHTYYYAGNKLLRETYGSNTLDFFYNADGSPYALKYNGTLYYYITNLQGDVMRVVDADGNGVARYRYDPYGNLIYSSGNFVSTNPLRYRGYYYDSETGFYYLQSRYYDPEIGRFINADDFASTGQGILGHNMFAYCNNNPACSSDYLGCAPVHLQAYVEGRNATGRFYITDQDDPNIADKQFGLATVSHGGCGVVASYNALITLGASKSFDDVLAYFNKSMYRVFGCGLTGLLPQDIAYYFASLGYTVCITSQKNQIDELSQTADACIMYYEFPQTYTILNCIPINAYGAHFIEYHKVGSGYRGMNTNGRNGISYFGVPSDFGYSGTRYYAVGIFIFA